MELSVHYKRKMDRNYMVINGEEGIFQPNYEMRMLAENEIQGFMKLSIMLVDCHLEYYYDISSMQPLSRIYQKQKIGLKEVQTLFFTLKRQMELMAPYLLEGYHLVLEPDYIYVQPQTFQVYFCYHTEITNDFQQALRELIQFVLEKLNHEDQDGIVAVYQMYQRSLETSITIEELLKILFASYEIGEKQEEKQNMWRGEFVDTIYDSSPSAITEQFSRNRGDVPCYKPAHFKKTILWDEEKKKQRLVILIGSIVILIAAICFVVSNEMWKETRTFLLFLGITTVGILYNIWNVQQMKQEDTIQYQRIQEKNEGLLAISYEDEKLENECELENGRNLEEDGEIETVKKTESQKEVLPGNTGPLENRENHAFISDNPGLWSHIQMTQYPYVIGRIPESCNVVLEFQEISRLHAEIQKKENEMWIMDLNSSNGTYVNGERLEANTPVIIKSGDKVSFAQISYTFY